jgi:hypothetical protein
MDIHKPKPIHGWREFLKEYGIIVIGVLTALAAEQAVEWASWRHKMADARQALGREITYNIKALELMDAQNDCLHAKLAALESWANGTGARPEGRTRAPLLYNLQTSTWDVVNSGQVVAHFPLDLELRYATQFSRFENERDAINDERSSWGEIVALANQPAPEREDLRRLREVVGVAKFRDERRRGNSGNIIRLGRPLGVEDPGPLRRALGDEVAWCGTAGEAVKP